MSLILLGQNEYIKFDKAKGACYYMHKQRFMDLSNFVCPTCGNVFPIMRSHGRKREAGHIKDIWCPFCKTDQKFLEVKKGEAYKRNNGKVIY